MSETFDVAIVGAGISGLSFAHHAASAGLRSVVLEAAARAGGCIQTARTSNGFWFELGTHTLYNSYGSLLDILVATQLRDAVARRHKAPFRLFVDGRVRSVSSELALGELLATAWRIFTERKAGRTVGDYYGSLVGKRNWQRVFSPLLSAVPCQRADDFPAEMLFKRRPRRKDFPRTFTLVQGLSTLVDRLAQANAIELRCNASVQKIGRDPQGFALTANDGSTWQARSLALAVPPEIAAQILAQLAPAAAEALSRIRTATIDSTGVVVAKDRLSFPRILGLVPLDNAFSSAVSRDVVPDDRWRGIAFHFRMGLTRDERLDRIATVLGISRCDFAEVFEHRSFLPSPGLGPGEIVKAIARGIPGSRVFRTGNYFGGLAIEDCVLRSKSEVSRLVSESATK